MKSTLCSISFLLCVACASPPEDECAIEEFILHSRVEVEVITNHIDASEFNIANQNLDALLEERSKLLKDPLMAQRFEGFINDSGLRHVYADSLVSNGDLEGGVREKLSIARGGIESLAYVCGLPFREVPGSNN